METGLEPPREQVARPMGPESESPRGQFIRAVEPGPEPPLQEIAQAIEPGTKPSPKWVAQTVPQQPELLPGPVPRPVGADLSIPPSLGSAGPTTPGGQPKKTSLAPRRIIAFILLGFIILALIAGLTFLRPQVTSLVAGLFPKVGCSPSLVINTSSFQMKTIKPGSDGSLVVPANQPDRAYWVDGTDTNLVFGLSAVPDNLSLVSSLNPAATAAVTWANCNTASYNLSAPLQGLPDNTSLLDQSISQITIFIPGKTASSGMVVHGMLQGETITTFATPDYSSLQAEISLLDTATSSDGTTITVGVSINNTGQKAITVNASDVSLTPANSAAVALLKSDPGLPKEIAPGGTETIYFTFSRPGTPTATLKVLGVEYDLEGY